MSGRDPWYGHTLGDIVNISLRPKDEARDQRVIESQYLKTRSDGTENLITSEGI